MSKGLPIQLSCAEQEKRSVRHEMGDRRDVGRKGKIIDRHVGGIGTLGDEVN